MFALGLLGCSLVGLLAAGIALDSPPRRLTLLFASLLGTMTVFPFLRVISGAGASHSDVAPAGPFVALWAAALVGGLAFIAWQLLAGTLVRATPPVLVTAFATSVVVAYLLIWARTPEHTSGVMSLLLATSAAVVGAVLGPQILALRRGPRYLANSILAIVTIETLVSVAQRAGAAINPMPASLAVEMGDRTNGTLDHPNNLAKVILLLVILALALMGTSDTVARRRLALSLLLAVLPLGLSEGRATVIAALFTAFLWAVLSPRRTSAALRVAVPLIAVAATLPFALTLAHRFVVDPEGGARPQLLTTGLHQVALRPWAGTGPNAYVSTVAPFSSLAAQGFPVHNTFLLTAAEFGIPLAVLFWLPILRLFVDSWRARARGGFAGSFGLAMIASAPGMFVVLWTGWGMMSTSVLPLWCLIMGFTHSQVRGAQRSEVAASQPLQVAPL